MLVIEDDEGGRTVVPFAQDALTLGRDESNTVRLTERNVSRRHARLRRVDGQVLVEDLGSAFGVRINGERIQGPRALRDGDRLEIGSFGLVLEREGAVAGETAPAASVVVSPAELAHAPVLTEVPSEAPAPALAPPPSPAAEAAVPRATPQLPARLRVLNTESSGREFPCTGAELRIGRAEDNDVVLEHRSLSRTHARLVREADGQWAVLDLQSANGIFVNGERRDRAVLRSGDVVELGQVRLRFIGEGMRGPLPLSLRALTAGLAAAAVLVVGGALLLRAPTAPVAPAPASAAPAPARPAAAQPPAAQPAVPGPAAVQPTAVQPTAVQPAAARPAAVQAAAVPPAAAAQPAVVAPTPATPAPSTPPTAAAPAPAAQRPSDAQGASAARAPAAAPAAVAQEPKRRPSPAKAGQEEAGRRTKALQLYEEGRKALSRGDVKQAEEAFKRCLAVDAGAAVCHLGLGGTYARMPGQAESGAAHYRRFLELAPQDPAVPEVQQLLADYEKARRALQE